MKMIGLLGGMSWESSLEYYRIINETTRLRRGGLHSAPCVLVSMDFAEIEVLQQKGRWSEAAARLMDAGRSLERAGADFVVLCTNTMHLVADELQAGLSIPLLHIADATAHQVRAAGIQTVGLLGTRFTMERDFYKGRLSDRHGLTVLIPNADDRETVHRVIYAELCQGVIRPESRAQYRVIIEKLGQAGAEGIILGCTEIELLVHEEDSPVPLFPTTRIHATAAVDYALA